MSWFRLDETSGTIAAVVLMLVAIALRPVRRRWSIWLGAAALETAIVCGLFALWQAANDLTHTHLAGGLAHGRTVWHVERWLHIPSEASLQGLILGHRDIVRATNYYYATAHLTGMFVFLVWLWLRHRDRYRQWRNVVAIFTGIALLIEMIPVAPPRLLSPQLTGLVDLPALYHQSVYTALGSGFADQYAALPSIHVGWALLIGVAVYSCGRGPGRWVGAVHAVLTLFAVVATANHYWLDGLTAATVLLVASLIERLLRRLVLRLRGQETCTPEESLTIEPAAV